MSCFKAVTTFAPQHWDIYAEQCVKSWIKHWPGSVVIYYEGAPPPLVEAEFRPLSDIEERSKFLEIDIPRKEGYLFDAKRFCHKAFSQLDMDEPFFWIDADVLMYRDMPQSTLEEFLEGHPLCYLGRDTYTETGFVGFNTEHPDYAAFKRRYKRMYLGDIFKLDYWTDCHAFDASRKGLGNNLSPTGRGVENVFQKSPLVNYMCHFKGNRKYELYRRSHEI